MNGINDLVFTQGILVLLLVLTFGMSIGYLGAAVKGIRRKQTKMESMPDYLVFKKKDKDKNENTGAGEGGFDFGGSRVPVTTEKRRYRRRH